MKKVLLTLLIVVLVLAVLCTAGVFLFRHFVTDRIMDKGGMENPDCVPEEAEPPVYTVDFTEQSNDLQLQGGDP